MSQPNQKSRIGATSLMRIKKMKWFLAFFPVVLFVFCATGCPIGKNSHRPLKDGLLFDTAGIVQQAGELLTVLEHYRNQFDTEMVIATLDGIPGSEINQYAQKLFYDWDVGRRYGGKGILLLVDSKTGQSRLEVSYQLEHVLTDVMCGRIIRNQVRPFWEMDMIYVGMLDAVFLISERSRLLALERSEAMEQAQLEDEHLSGGGGVTLPVRFGLGSENKVRLSYDDRIQFGPGQTPLETIEKFRLALSRGINDNTLGLYTPHTQVFFAMEPVLTEEYRAYADIISECGPFNINTDGMRAVVRMDEACEDRFPIFCLKNHARWQLDWVTFFQSHGRELRGGWKIQRTPIGYEHLMPEAEKPPLWWSRLPVYVDPTKDFRVQIYEAEQQLKENPDSPENNLQMADLYLSCWRWPDALRLYSIAFALSPDNPMYLLALAEAKYYLYFMKSARRNYEKLSTFPHWRRISDKRLHEIQRWFGDE